MSSISLMDFSITQHEVIDFRHQFIDYLNESIDYPRRFIDKLSASIDYPQQVINYPLLPNRSTFMTLSISRSN